MHRALAHRAIALGSLGELRVVRARIWLARPPRHLSIAGIWGLWLAAAGSLAVAGWMFSIPGWSIGLLLGGSLSHAAEMSIRGSVYDYIVLRFWPAFNLADVALTIGAAGLSVQVYSALLALSRP